jgi:MFS family permease
MVMAFVPSPPTVAFCLLLSGMSWLSILSTINTAIQLSVPGWVKARAFGSYHMVWGGSMALGAAFWGAVAQRLGLRMAFALSAAGMLVTLLAVGRLRITAFDEELDLSPHRDAPHPPSRLPMDAGPILVQLEYRIPETKRNAFLEAIREVRGLRLRDGAMRWSLFEEPERGEDGSIRFMESFLSASMGEHLRQHHRATMADREVLARAFRLDITSRPVARHLVAVGDQDAGFLQRILH